MEAYLSRYPKVRWIIGIDEAGRGPIAGGVSVGAVAIPRKFDPAFFKGIRDSKKMTAPAREAWFSRLREGEQAGKVAFSHSSTGPGMIDRVRVVRAIDLAIRRAMQKFCLPPNECLVLLDGSLRAPEEYLFQETIIGGDDTIPVISAAAVVAKVSRDRKMSRLAARYPKWGFEKHKGYGTKEHYKNISVYGISDIHRRSYLGLET